MKSLKERIQDARSSDGIKMLELCDDIEKELVEDDDHEMLGYMYFYKGEAYYVSNNIKPMFEYMTKAVPYLSETGQWTLLARAYNIMAITSINRGNAPIAVDYYLEALDCAQKHRLGVNECSIRINLGYLYMQNGVYNEAINQFEAAYSIFADGTDKEAQLGRLIMIYTNLASCYLLQEDVERAGEYVDRLDRECRPKFLPMDHVYVGCMEARYFHMKGEPAKRDKVIGDILHSLEEQLPILDLFDDLYSLCELTFSMGAFDICSKIIGHLEKAIENTDIINMERKLLEIKIQYYKLKNDTEKYAASTQRFYEIVKIMEEESQRMIANMISVRTVLEQVKKQNEFLLEKSETDELTGLANRYRLTEYLQQFMDECLRAGVPYAVEILDIDYFKEYNDNYGHQAGDGCIKSVASLLKGMQDEHVFCARYGGDEFIVIYKGLAQEEIRRRAVKLKTDIMDMHIEHKYSKTAPIVTISQGICVRTPMEGNKSWDFLHQADNYLYQVKRETRNGICIGDVETMELIL